MKKVLIITGPGFEDAEYIYPFYRLQEAGYVVDVSTCTDQKVVGKYGITVTPTVELKNIKSSVYDGLIIPGGCEAPDRMRQVKFIIDLTLNMFKENKIISAICHGPWVMVSAGILRGKRATSYKGCKDDLVNAGAIYTDEPVVVDSNLVTAQHYRDNPAWMRETLLLLDRQRL